MDRSKEEILGSTVPEVWGQERFDNNIREKLDRAFKGEEVHFAERFTFGPFERDMQVSMYPYESDGNSEITHVAVFSYDVSRVSQIEQKLANYEFRDVQTGLFNRRSLDVILDMEIEKATASPENKLRALLYIALQNLDSVVPSCVIGVAVYPDDGQDRDSLIQSAISARLEAQRRGEQFLIYNEELHKLAYARMALTTELSRAFESESFAIHFHPIVDLDGQVVGAEALLRWSRADGKAQADRNRRLDRRLWHGALLPQLPQKASSGDDEDRQGVHRRAQR
jgi:hypothetical protein